VGTKLGVQVSHVGLDSVERDVQLAGDLRPGQVGRQLAQHAQLTVAQIALFAFPVLEARVEGGNTVLTGRLADQAALYGVLAEAEALGLELIEVRRLSE
jgi:hypothetical protein